MGLGPTEPALDAEISLYLVEQKGRQGVLKQEKALMCIPGFKDRDGHWKGGEQPPGTDPQSRGARISNNQNEFGGRFFPSRPIPRNTLMKTLS